MQTCYVLIAGDIKFFFVVSSLCFFALLFLKNLGRFFISFLIFF